VSGTRNPAATSSSDSLSLLERLTTIGHLPDDSRYTRTRKTTLVVTTIIGAIVVIPWGLF
jgi:hypothetical protein